MAVNQTSVRKVNCITFDRLFAHQRCLLCFTEGEIMYGVCRRCRADLVYNAPACHLCARPIPEYDVCGRCLSRPHPPWSALRAAFSYGWPVDRLLQQLKFHQDLNMAGVLSGLCSDFFIQHRKTTALPDLLVAVPLHRRRLLHRGYNQAQELARGFAKSTGIPADPLACARRRFTSAQTGLDARQRRQNLRGAFCSRPQRVRDKTIALVDDVVTTGSTVRAVAESLLAAGAREVEIWAVAIQHPGR